MLDSSRAQALVWMCGPRKSHSAKVEQLKAKLRLAQFQFVFQRQVLLAAPRIMPPPGYLGKKSLGDAFELAKLWCRIGGRERELSIDEFNVAFENDFPTLYAEGADWCSG